MYIIDIPKANQSSLWTPIFMFYRSSFQSATVPKPNQSTTSPKLHSDVKPLYKLSLHLPTYKNFDLIHSKAPIEVVPVREATISAKRC